MAATKAKRKRWTAPGETTAPETPTPNHDDTIAFLSKKEVLARIPVTGPTLWHWSRTGRFPKPRTIGGRTVWIKHEVIEWMRTRPLQNYKEAKSKGAA
jgi:predicted DNA-binding transcriptional regulator AlpA